MVNKQRDGKFTYTCDQNGCMHIRRNLTSREADIEGTNHPKAHALSCGCMPPYKDCTHNA